jgi:hypothetical protein
MKHSLLHIAGQSDATSAAIDPMKKGFQKPIHKNCTIVQYSIGSPTTGTTLDDVGTPSTMTGNPIFDHWKKFYII